MCSSSVLAEVAAAAVLGSVLGLGLGLSAAAFAPEVMGEARRGRGGEGELEKGFFCILCARSKVEYTGIAGRFKNVQPTSYALPPSSNGARGGSTN